MSHLKLAASYFALSLVASVQSQTSLAPTFEVASVKPSTPASSHGAEFNFAPGGGLAIRNGEVKGIIQMAFDVQEFQIAGAPGWTASERYDIFTKSTDDNRASSPAELREDARRKLQTLLAERFQLLFHRENRQLAVYHLTLSRGGPKFAASRDSGPNGGISGRCGQLTATNASIRSLAYMLSRELASPVDDQTGLAGRYDFQLEFAPSGSCQQAADTSDKTAATASLDRPSVFAALQEQIGLKLETGKGLVETIVVDRIERPTGN